MEGFKLIGIKLEGKTQNANGQSANDCGALWQYFGANTIAERIPNKMSQDIYAVYYEYESDENGLFSYFIGCKVEPYTVKPKGLDEVIIPEQNYHIETAKGKVPACIAEAWVESGMEASIESLVMTLKYMVKKVRTGRMLKWPFFFR